jgi:hypothetical protein
MNISGMYMLNSEDYNQEKIHQALDMMYVDRKNQFRELSEVLLPKNTISTMSTWIEFVLNFILVGVFTIISVFVPPSKTKESPLPYK